MWEACAAQELPGGHHVEIVQSRLRAGPLEKRWDSFLSLLELTQQLATGFHCPVAVSDPIPRASVLLSEVMEVWRGCDMESEDTAGRVLWNQLLLDGRDKRWRHPGPAPVKDLPLDFLVSPGGHSDLACHRKTMIVASLLHP